MCDTYWSGGGNVVSITFDAFNDAFNEFLDGCDQNVRSRSSAKATDRASDVS